MARAGDFQNQDTHYMEYTFAAERKVVLIVQTGGRNRLVEFGERNGNGVAEYFTTNDAVAQAIRRHSLSRRGVIVETTRQQQAEPEKPKAAVVQLLAQAEQTESGVPVRAYDNFTFAREAICKEFDIPKSSVRSMVALEAVAKEHGFTIKYSNAR